MAHPLRLLVIASVVVFAAHTYGYPTKVSDGPLQERLVVLGDIHGDLEQTIGILKMAEVIDDSGSWRRIIEMTNNNGNNNTSNNNTSNQKVRFLNRLIQVGDLLDRGEKDKEVMDFFINLSADAESRDKEAGMDWSTNVLKVKNDSREKQREQHFETEGIIIHLKPVNHLLGNHELLNLIGDYRYSHPKSHKAFAILNGGKEDGHNITKSKSKLLKNRKSAFSSKGKYGRWIRDKFKIVMLYNDTVFVHAGLRSEFATYGADTLHELATNALNRDDYDNVLFSSRGPIWTRSIVNKAKNGVCDLLDAALKAIGAKRMVVGHTPERDLRIGSYCNSRLLTVDVGISKWMYGGFSAIEIITNPNSHETEIREILPNNYQRRTNEELAKLRDQGGMDGSMLEEILQSVQEEEKFAATRRSKGKTQRHNRKMESNVNDEL